MHIVSPLLLNNAMDKIVMAAERGRKNNLRN